MREIARYSEGIKRYWKRRQLPVCQKICEENLVKLLFELPRQWGMSTLVLSNF
jgi:hypothetical protein